MNRKTIRDSLIGFLMGVIGMLSIYITIGDEYINEIFLKSSWYLLIFSLITSPFIAIFLHEIGHVFFGIIQGFKLELFVVGFLGINRKKNKLHVFFNDNFQLFRGVASLIPQKKYTNLRLKFALILFGGPFFSLLFGAILLGISKYNIDYLNILFFTTGIFSILILFATTLPEKSGSLFTDRARLQRLLSNDIKGQIEIALLESINRNLIDGHCKNLDLKQLEIIKVDKEPSVQFWGYFFELNYLRDNNLIDAKDIFLLEKVNSYKDYFPKPIWKSFNIENS